MKTPVQNNLRMFREKAGLPQAKVAEATGRQSSDRISRWENGQSLPSVVKLFMLANLFNVTPGALYEKEYETLRTMRALHS